MQVLRILLLLPLMKLRFETFPQPVKCTCLQSVFLKDGLNLNEMEITEDHRETVTQR